jgi:predicted nucleic acid-binding protein
MVFSTRQLNGSSARRMLTHSARSARAAAPARPPAKPFVDSGGWIALRSRRDQHHAEADRLFREAIERRLRLVTTNLIIAELHRLTLYRAGLEPALRDLERIDASPSTRIHFATTKDHEEGRRWLERLAPRPIAYTDAVSFAVMGAAKCNHVLGFDNDFVAAGFELWRGR